VISRIIVIDRDLTRGVATGRGYIGIYIPPQKKKNQSTLQILCGYWLLFFLFDPGQIRYRASVRLTL